MGSNPAVRGADRAYVVVPDAGHMVLLEKPDEVTAALSVLLRTVGAGAPVPR